jgi:hypothetical protein
MKHTTWRARDNVNKQTEYRMLTALCVRTHTDIINVLSAPDTCVLQILFGFRNAGAREQENINRSTSFLLKKKVLEKGQRYECT